MALHPAVVAEREERLEALVKTPTFVVVAASLPGLFAASSLECGLAMGVVSAVSILAALGITRLTRRFTGAFSFLPVTLMLCALVSVLMGFAVRLVDPVVYESLGIYVWLASLNACAMAFVARDGFGCEGALGSSVKTALFAAIAVLATLAFVGLVNGVLSTGVIFGLTCPELAETPLAIFGKPAGSLLVLALVATFVQSVCDACKGGEC